MPDRRSEAEAQQATEDLVHLDAVLVEHGAARTLLDRVASLRGAARSIRDSTGAHIGFLAEMGESDDPAVIRWLSGNRTDALHEVAVPSGLGIGGQVLASGAAVRVNDYVTAPGITHHYDGPVIAESLGAMLAVPVTDESGRIVALAYAGMRGDLSFGDTAVDELRRVAGRTGAALQVATGVEQHLRTAILDERKRMQLAMHDSVGAMLFNIGAQVHDLHSASRRNPQLVARLRRLEADVSAASTALRESLLTLGDNAAEAETAAALAAAEHCRSFTARTGVPARLVQLTSLPPLDIERTGTLVAAAREGLLNVEKHARAGSVVVSIGRTEDGVQLAVADDGPGTSTTTPSSRLGLRALTERAERIGGRVSLVLDPDGATLRTWIPVVEKVAP